MIKIPREEAQKVLDALEKIIEGCNEVEKDEGIHKDGKDLARLVRIDCRAPAEVLRERLLKRDWKGLTKDEISNWDLPDSPTVYEFAQFVEAKLKEKNSGR